MVEKEFKRSEEDILRKRFYVSRICPDCLKPRDFLQGPRGGLSVNIKCRFCGAEFNVCPQTRFIEKIAPIPRRVQGSGDDQCSTG